MKLTKTASGKTALTITRMDWEKIGKQNGWIKEAQAQLSVSAIETALLNQGQPGLADKVKGIKDPKELWNFKLAGDGNKDALSMLLKKYIQTRPIQDYQQEMPGQQQQFQEQWRPEPGVAGGPVQKLMPGQARPGGGVRIQ